MRLVILRWLLKGGHTLEIVLPEAEAKKHLSDFGQLPPGVESRVGGYDRTQDRTWSVSLAEVQAAFCYDYEAIMKAAKQGSQPGAAGRGPANWGSGSNN